MYYIFTCPVCGMTFGIKGFWRWILKSPFHWFNKRLLKCPRCEEKSWMKWHMKVRSKERG